MLYFILQQRAKKSKRFLQVFWGFFNIFIEIFSEFVTQWNECFLNKATFPTFVYPPELSNEKSWNLEQHLVHANYHGIFPHLACHFSGGDLVEKALSETSNVNQCLTMNGSMDYLFRKQARGSLGFRTKRVIDHQEPIPSHEELQSLKKNDDYYYDMKRVLFISSLWLLLHSWIHCLVFCFPGCQ